MKGGRLPLVALDVLLLLLAEVDPHVLVILVLEAHHLLLELRLDQGLVGPEVVRVPFYRWVLLKLSGLMALPCVFRSVNPAYDQNLVRSEPGTILA